MVGIPNIDGSLVVAACGPKQGIGLNGELPWPHLSADLKHFAKLTRGGAVVMGSATFLSLPSSSKPLPGRLNIVLSSRTRSELGCPNSVLVLPGFDEAEQVLRLGAITKVFVIGGGSIYTQALQRPYWSRRVYYTEIKKEFDADTFFNANLEAKDSSFTLASVSEEKEENGVTFCMKEFVRHGPGPHRELTALPSPEHEEMQYLKLVRKIITKGVCRGDRTGVGTLALFGEQMRFSLRDSFPLLTTKRVFWRGVAEELFWFIKGSTDAKLLTEKGVRIWEGNGSRSFLDSRGFTDREEGDLGPVYGFQWRHFGAEYTTKNGDYRGAGKDQLTEVINTIINNPNDRRMIISAWNPCATDKMALPPCHLLAQFFVANGELSCQMYQRSCDMGLGVPFNIASYSLLTCLIAKITGLRPGEFIHVLGDTHVYNNHIEALKEQIERQPRAFPKLTIRDKKNIEDFDFEDLQLEGYNPHKSISMQMAV